MTMAIRQAPMVKIMYGGRSGVDYGDSTDYVGEGEVVGGGANLDILLLIAYLAVSQI